MRQTLGAGEVVTAYGYDAHGNLTSVADPNGNVTSYLYDDFGQMLRQVSQSRERRRTCTMLPGT